MRRLDRIWHQSWISTATTQVPHVFVWYFVNSLWLILLWDMVFHMQLNRWTVKRHIPHALRRILARHRLVCEATGHHHASCALTPPETLLISPDFRTLFPTKLFFSQHVTFRTGFLARALIRAQARPINVEGYDAVAGALRWSHAPRTGLLPLDRPPK